MKQFRNILWGLVLIVIGVIIGLNSLDITDIDLFFDGWWTLFIIVPCFIDLFKDDDKTSNIIGLVIGVVLLLCCQDFLDFSIIWKLFVPFILVMIGLSFIFKDVIDSKVKKEIKKLAKNKTSDNDYCATFGTQTVDYANEEFKGCEMTAVFGEVKCDLRNAIIKDDAAITATAIFGGIDIIVPEDVNVKVTSTPIFGGVSNKKGSKDKKGKTIYINATCVFGGVDIK